MLGELCDVLNPWVKCQDCEEQWCEPCWRGANSHSEKDNFGSCPLTGRRVKWDTSEGSNESRRPTYVVSYPED